ncbi:MAG: hypothetical protein FJ290_01845 [Planctomycetes bacterium]|nr:hypothetical protein [Planctomycetota bacterium]
MRCAWLAGVFGVWAALAAAEEKAVEKAADPKVLYDEFEGLNRRENLDREFVGGQPPQFIRRQAELLQAIAGRGAKEAVPLLLRIATEHVERVEGMKARDFRQSPLQAIQVPIVDALSRHASSEEVRRALARLAGSAGMKEYAKGRALDVLAAHAVAQVSDADDPKGEKRAKVLMETLVGALSLAEVLQAPGRLRSLARRAGGIGGGDPVAPWRALAGAADSVAKRYAADAALAIACVQQEIKGEGIVLPVRELLVGACGRWLKEYRAEVQKQKYPSDLLGESILRLGARLDYEPLAQPLRDAKLIPPQ